MAAPPDAPHPPPGGPAPLVGRERERTTLRHALDNALAGRGSLVLIGGEAGIGKTALAEWALAEAADQGALVLVGHCYDLSETPPYGPWRELFERAPREDGLPALPAAVLPVDREGAVLGSQEAIVARVRDYLAALAAKQPAILLLEDLHWVDPTSLDLLRAVARRLADLPVLLLGTYRADEVGQGHPLFVLLPLLVREARADRLDLRPLDRDAIGGLVAGRYALDAAEVVRLTDYLAGRTEGNALFLGEVLRTLEGEGLVRRAGTGWVVGDLSGAPMPALLRQVIAGRAARLGAETQRLLAVAAVIGQDVPPALWATVGEVAEDDLLGYAERALEERLLVEVPDGTGVRFPHALVREALYAGLPAFRRRALHRRIGEALAGGPRPDPDAVASHFQHAGDPRAVEWLVRAGLRAWRATARLTAADRFRAAALLDADEAHARERAALLLLSGDARAVSDPAPGLRDYAAAEPLAEAAGDGALAAYCRFRQGQARCYAGAARLGVAALARAVAELAALPADADRRLSRAALLATVTDLLPVGTRPPVAAARPGLILTCRCLLAHWLALTGHYREALAHGEAIVAAFAASDALDATLAAPAHRALGHAHAALGRPAAARRAYARDVAAHQARDDWLGVAFACEYALHLAVLPYHADDLGERARLVGEARQAWARAQGVATAADHGALADLPVALLEGRWATARELALGGLTDAAFSDLASAAVARGVLARHQGEPDVAWAQVRTVLPAGPRPAPPDVEFRQGLDTLALAADLALDVGDLAAAEGWIEAYGRWVAWSGAVLWRATHRLLQARQARHSGDTAAARAHAEAALAHAAEPRQPLALLAARRLLGELETVARRHGEAAADLEAALALADACAAPYERALTLLALAELRATAGDGEGAAQALAEARALLAPLEARPALARAAALAARLATAAAAPPRAARPFGLTAREAEVLRLVAQGLTNPQVAARLFVTPRTVNAHLTAVYTKLGVDGRAAAIRRALDHGLR